MLLTRAPLYQGRSPFSCDLHVLGAPLTFVLSQDQTLQLNLVSPRGACSWGAAELGLWLCVEIASVTVQPGWLEADFASPKTHSSSSLPPRLAVREALCERTIQFSRTEGAGGLRGRGRYSSGPRRDRQARLVILQLVCRKARQLRDGPRVRSEVRRRRMSAGWPKLSTRYPERRSVTAYGCLRRSPARRLRCCVRRLGGGL